MTDEELTAQLCALEAKLELRVGDTRASQIIRDACRSIELKTRAIGRLQDQVARLAQEVETLQERT